MSALTCPRCAGEIEYETERVDDGDGVWAQSGYTGVVDFEPLVWDAVAHVFTGPLQKDGNYTHGMTGCGCVWKADEIEWLHDRASEAASEPPGEP